MISAPWSSWTLSAVGATNGSQRVQPPSDSARPSQNVLTGQALPLRLSQTVKLPKRAWNSLTRKRSLVQIQYGPRIVTWPFGWCDPSRPGFWPYGVWPSRGTAVARERELRVRRAWRIAKLVRSWSAAAAQLASARPRVGRIGHDADVAAGQRAGISVPLRRASHSREAEFVSSSGRPVDGWPKCVRPGAGGRRGNRSRTIRWWREKSVPHIGAAAARALQCARESRSCRRRGSPNAALGARGEREHYQVRRAISFLSHLTAHAIAVSRRGVVAEPVLEEGPAWAVKTLVAGS